MREREREGRGKCIIMCRYDWRCIFGAELGVLNGGF